MGGVEAGRTTSVGYACVEKGLLWIPSWKITLAEGGKTKAQLEALGYTD